MSDEGDRMKARVEMLRREAELGFEQALEAGPAWHGFNDQITIANRCNAMALALEGRILDER